MKIGQKFNQLTEQEYYFYIDNHQKYTDFNTLGLYRSLLENEKLSLQAKISVRDYAHKSFKKAFDFLQLKDPFTFVKVSTLEQPLTRQEEEWIWKEVKQNQEKILKEKRIKHRNFGIYSKHNCGSCILHGLMIRQGSPLTEDWLQFHSDRNQYTAKDKSNRRRKERKAAKRIIEANLTKE